MEAAAPWWKRAVFYQVYPRSFADSNGDGVGDLPGVTGKLPYLADLGVDAVWLSPFFTSPMDDFGYDVSDYRSVDPIFGTLADFDALITEAHRLGLKLIIDQVWSHTSSRHPWFENSESDGEKSDWYVWDDARPDGTPPNNWQASFGGPSWTWSPRRRQYYLHNFLPSQPDLNFWNPAVQDAILDVARFWLDRGVDGFRLDVANYYFQDARLRDNPVLAHARAPATTQAFQSHVFDRSRPETLGFIARVRDLLDSYGDRMAVGEIFDGDMLAAQKLYTQGPRALHTAYSFFLLHARHADPTLFARALAGWGPADGWPSWSLGNHDVPRFPTRLAGGGAPDAARTKALLAALLCLRGTPFLYQGDELGLPQADVPFERLRDPFAIAAWAGGAGGSGRDGARTPMPWRDAPGGGFSSAARTWLPLDPEHLPLAVIRQREDDGSTLNFTRALLALRRTHPALQTGEIEVLAGPDGVLAFERRDAAGRLLCMFELAGRAAHTEVPAGARLLPSPLAGDLSDGVLRLPAFGGSILALS